MILDCACYLPLVPFGLRGGEEVVGVKMDLSASHQVNYKRPGISIISFLKVSNNSPVCVCSITPIPDEDLLPTLECSLRTVTEFLCNSGSILRQGIQHELPRLW